MSDNILVSAAIDELPPSVNAIWRSAHKNWRVFKTTAAKNWQQKAIQKLKANKEIDEPYEGKVWMFMVIKTKTKRRMDIDNRLKAAIDCLAPAEIIKDDSQVWSLNVQRVVSDEDSVLIDVYKMDEENEKDGI